MKLPIAAFTVLLSGFLLVAAGSRAAAADEASEYTPPTDLYVSGNENVEEAEAEAEESDFDRLWADVKAGAAKTGESIKSGSSKAAAAIKSGAAKTSDAVKRGYEKVKDYWEEDEETEEQ